MSSFNERMKFSLLLELAALGATGKVTIDEFGICNTYQLKNGEVVSVKKPVRKRAIK